MNDHLLPPDTHVGQVHLQVADLQRSLAFYSDLLGFQQAGQENDSAILSAASRQPGLIRLTGRPGAPPKPPRTTGLFHVAIRLPNRRALARLLQRLLENNYPLQGASDHRVSEALYLADPDRNGLELYVDRPREAWPRQDGQIEMVTEPLDIQGLLAEAQNDKEAWTGIHPGTDIGHVHLQVADLGTAEDFYHDLIGLEVTQRTYPGALFLSAGGYHHHVGLNIWNSRGAPPPPAEAAGLLSFGLQIPDAAAWEAAVERLERAGVAIEERGSSNGERRALVRDPSGNRLALLTG